MMWRGHNKTLNTSPTWVDKAREEVANARDSLTRYSAEANQKLIVSNVVETIYPVLTIGYRYRPGLSALVFFVQKYVSIL